MVYKKDNQPETNDGPGIGDAVEELHISYGQNIDISCKLGEKYWKYNPIIWYKDGKHIAESARFTFSQGSLIIRNVVADDIGMYTCEAGISPPYKKVTKVSVMVLYDKNEANETVEAPNINIDNFSNISKNEALESNEEQDVNGEVMRNGLEETNNFEDWKQLQIEEHVDNQTIDNYTNGRNETNSNNMLNDTERDVTLRELDVGLDKQRSIFGMIVSYQKKIKTKVEDWHSQREKMYAMKTMQSIARSSGITTPILRAGKINMCMCV